MNRDRATAILSGLALLIGAAHLALKSCDASHTLSGDPTPPPRPRYAAPDRTAAERPSAPKGLARTGEHEGETSRAKLLAGNPHYQAVARNLARLLGELEVSGDPEHADAIRELLRSSAAEASIAAILDYLDSGADAATGGDFVVGTSAFLDSAPTVRVLMLDILGEIDAQLAAEYAKTILADSRSADEWAIALRNYVSGHHLRDRGAALADDYLTGRIEEALGNESWAKEPSVGFLHAIDFAVLAPERESVGALAGLAAAQPGEVHPAVQRVARAQLWRLAHRDLTGTVSLLDAADVLGGLDVDERAVLYAHADLREAGERAVIEEYLSGVLPETELARFAEVFPYFGLEVTNHIATQNERIDMKDDADAVLEAYTVVREWRRDGKFPDKDAALGQVEARLEHLARSIERGLRQDEG